jgi:hypothetical protein
MNVVGVISKSVFQNLKYGDELIVDTRFFEAVMKQTPDQPTVETRNLRTEEVHIIPLYKLRRIHKIFNFTIFDDISINKK